MMHLSISCIKTSQNDAGFNMHKLLGLLKSQTYLVKINTDTTAKSPSTCKNGSNKYILFFKKYCTFKHRCRTVALGKLQVDIAM